MSIDDRPLASAASAFIDGCRDPEGHVAACRDCIGVIEPDAQA